MSESEDRPIPASERRKTRSRESGTLPVRRAVVGLSGVLGGVLGLAATDMAGALTQMLRSGLQGAAHTSVVGNGTEAGAAPLSAAELGTAVVAVLGLAWPVLLGGVLGAVAGTLAQTAGVIAWNRPRTGMGQRLAGMAGPGAAARVLGGLSWTVLGSGGAALALAAQWPTVASLPQMPLAAGIRAGSQVCLLTALTAFALLAAMAIVDVVTARFHWTRQLAMTTQEAREEQRQSDGDPNVRVRRKRAAARLRGVLPRSGKEPMKGAAC